MSEYEKTEKEKECKCFCNSKGFRKFAVIALGTFVGVYAALSLFAAIHKPPMMPCPHKVLYGGSTPVASPCPCFYHHFGKGMDKAEFKKAVKEGRMLSPFDDDRDKD